MTQKIITQQPLKEVKEKIEAAITRSNSLLIKKMDERSFYLLSKKNYGSLSMIEKEYYNIKGKWQQQGAQTELSYEVKANSTYWIMSVILPIMMLPTIFLGAVGGDKLNLLTGLMMYLVLSGIAIFWTSRQSKKLKAMGQKDFEGLLESIELK